MNTKYCQSQLGINRESYEIFYEDGTYDYYYKNLDWERLSKLMRSPAWVFDTRSISNLDEAKSYGINIWRIGTDNSLLNNF